MNAKLSTPKVSCAHKTEDFIEQSLDLMRANGARITKTRIAVLNTLATQDKPITPSEIVQSLKKDKIGIDLVSVYRILHYLEELSLVHQVGTSSGYFPCVHNLCSSKTHLIISCDSCNQTSEVHLPDQIQQSLKTFLSEKLAFTSGKSLTIQGECSKCHK